MKDYELKPCPFCGGEAELCVHEPTGVSWVRCVECETTGIASSAMGAARAWDRRAEGTCKNDSLKRNAGVFVCSECGVYLDIADMNWDGEDDSGGFYDPNYCPKCGAKVIHQ